MENPNQQNITTEGIEAFKGLDSNQRKALASKLRYVQRKAGDTIIDHFYSQHDVYFIISGKIRVCMLSKSGKEVQMEDIGAGDMIGEIAALDGKNRTCDCVALTDTTLAVMAQRNFLDAVYTYNSFNHYIMMRLTNMLRHYVRRVFEFSTLAVKDRVRYEVFQIAVRYAENKYGEITVLDAPTHADIAARINTHREAVTRELKNLEKEGIITWKPGKYIVHNIEALLNPDLINMEVLDH